MTTLAVGDIIVLPKSFFEANRFITQFFPNLEPGVMLLVKSTIDFAEGLVGTDILEDIEGKEVFDISTIPELENYWCILDSSDNFRVIPQ